MGNTFRFQAGGVDAVERETRTSAKPVRSKSVTYVSGINRYPCVRNGPRNNGAGEGNRTLVISLEGWLFRTRVRSLDVKPLALSANRINGLSIVCKTKIFPAPPRLFNPVILV